MTDHGIPSISITRNPRNFRNRIHIKKKKKKKGDFYPKKNEKKKKKKKKKKKRGSIFQKEWNQAKS